MVIGLAGCGDISGEITSITVSPASTTVGIGKSFSFTVIAKDSVGKIVSVTPTWRVEGGIGSISSLGLFTAGGTEGSGTVIASYASVEGSAAVTVTAKGWLTGVMRTPEGAFAEGIIVYLSELSSLLDDTNSKGEYLISEIPAGTYEARTRETQIFLPASQEVTIASGETVTWSTTLSFKPGTPTVPTTTIPTF